MHARDLVVASLGSVIVSGTTTALTRGRLRILAYHAVPCSTTFASHLDYIAATMTPVGLDEVLTWAHQRRQLPPRPVWITFDDGYPSVVDNALPLLSERGLTSTLFVCPGHVGTDEPFWWDRVGPAAAPALKRLPDGERRRQVAAASRTPVRQLTLDELARWQAAGQTLGNHTWDHPCLDQSPPAEARSQVRTAHDWLVRHFGPAAARAFAYPNGNFARAAEEELEALQYRVGVLFGHSLVGTSSQPMRLERLRIDSSAELPRARAIMSGAHSAAFQLASRFARR